MLSQSTKKIKIFFIHMILILPDISSYTFRNSRTNRRIICTLQEIYTSFKNLHNLLEDYLSNYYYYYYISSDYNIKKYFCQITKESIEYRVCAKKAWQFLPVRVRIRQRLAASLTPIPHTRG